MAAATALRGITYYELTLSQEEAQFVLDITGFIGGDPRLSRRKHAETIESTLVGVGLVYTEVDSEGNLDITGGLTIKDS
jgi:hypothetical protein